MTKRKNKITLRVFKTEEEMNAAVAARLKAERAGLKTVYRNIEDFPWAQPVLAWAERGDWDTLAKYILDGDEILREIREFLAAVLRGEKKRPKKRPPSLGHLMGPGGLWRGYGFLFPWSIKARSGIGQSTKPQKNMAWIVAQSSGTLRRTRKASEY
jgi:hypothetical protein